MLCLSRRLFLPADFSGAAVHFSISPFHHCGHSDVGEVGKEIWSAKGEKKIGLQEILYWSVWWVSSVWNLKPVFPPRPMIPHCPSFHSCQHLQVGHWDLPLYEHNLASMLHVLEHKVSAVHPFFCQGVKPWNWSSLGLGSLSLLQSDLFCLNQQKIFCFCGLYGLCFGMKYW